MAFRTTLVTLAAALLMALSGCAWGQTVAVDNQTATEACSLYTAEVSPTLEGVKQSLIGPHSDAASRAAALDRATTALNARAGETTNDAIGAAIRQADASWLAYLAAMDDTQVRHTMAALEDFQKANKKMGDDLRAVDKLCKLTGGRS